MNPAKCDAVDYIQFRAAKRRGVNRNHRKLHMTACKALWQETRGLVRREDDTTLEALRQAMELVSRHWSGKHKRVFKPCCGVAMR